MRYHLIFLCLVLLLYSCKSSRKPGTSNYTTGSSTKGKPYTPASPAKASDVIKAAKKYLGTPYKYSGMDKKGMDCSGFICTAFKDVGIVLPHQSEEQSKLGTSVKLNDLRPGDLVFMSATKGSSKISHVGMVVSVSDGKIMFIHASTKRGVIEENLLEKWYQPLFIKGARIL